jgi:hypothetical protein
MSLEGVKVGEKRGKTFTRVREARHGWVSWLNGRLESKGYEWCWWVTIYASKLRQGVYEASLNIDLLKDGLCFEKATRPLIGAVNSI